MPHVVITGAAGATGRAIAQLFFEQGASLCLVDILEEQLSEVAALFGDRAISVVADIAEPDSADRIISEVSVTLGPVDVLVNNAGVLSNNKATDTNDVEWQRVLGVNLNGAFFLSRAVLPMMRARRGGRIINVCSLAMKTGAVKIDAVQHPGWLYRLHAGLFPRAPCARPAGVPVRPPKRAVSRPDHAGNLRPVHIREAGTH